MDLRQLQVFRAVMDTGSATGAARLLGLSQPAISRQLSQISEDLGLELFVRQGNGLRPTANAADLYDEVARALDGIERVMNLAGRMHGRDGGVLRLAAPYGLGHRLLPGVVQRLLTLHRGLRFSVEFGTYLDVAAMVSRREVDIGILKEPLTLATLFTRPLVDSRAVCVLPPSHRLARQTTVTMDNLVKEPLVLLGRDTAWRSELHAAFKATGKVPQVRLETHSSGAICGLVRAGLGLSVLPSVFAAQHVDDGLVLRELDVDIVHRYVVATANETKRTRLFDAFVDTSRQAAQALLTQAGIDTPV